jgi:hypothetical protein
LLLEGRVGSKDSSAVSLAAVVILQQIQDGVPWCLKFYQKKEATLPLHRRRPTKVRRAITVSRKMIEAKVTTSPILLTGMISIGAGTIENFQKNLPAKMRQYAERQFSLSKMPCIFHRKVNALEFESLA